MSKMFLARQKIVNINGKIFAYELLFRDSSTGIKKLPSDIKATAQVMLNSLSHIDLDGLLTKEGIAFINVDSEIIESDVLELLDPKRFVIEILETVQLTSALYNKIVSLKKKGYKIALDDFDCSEEMLKNFQPLLKYLNVIKIDALTVNKDNLKKLLPKFKAAGIKLLIEKIENPKEYLYYKELGFDLFQGYHIGRPESFEFESIQDPIEVIILKLISIIKTDKETAEIERFIKLRPDLAYNIIKFINNQNTTKERISSIVQAVTLMGRDSLLRWLLVYLYAEVSGNEFSKPLLHAAVLRAETMEESASRGNKEEAFMVGMFSMLDSLFKVQIKDIFKGLNLSPAVTNALLYKTGELGKGLTEAIQIEKDYFKKVFLANFNKINPADIIIAFENNDIDY
ncbi:MAG: EAL domain-containing protein [Campylobacterales bacterium]|nr:EAL domain-containing protein [Campylobacterales bacterium]